MIATKVLGEKIGLVCSIPLWMIISKCGRLSYISFTFVLECIASTLNTAFEAKFDSLKSHSLSPLFPLIPLCRRD